MVVDTVQQQLNTRVVANETLLNDISWLDPRIFKEIQKLTVMPDEARDMLSDLAKVLKAEIRRELMQLAQNYAEYRPCQCRLSRSR